MWGSIEARNLPVPLLPIDACERPAPPAMAGCLVYLRECRVTFQSARFSYYPAKTTEANRRRSCNM
jgi:hypothetical protein